VILNSNERSIVHTFQSVFFQLTERVRKLERSALVLWHFQIRHIHRIYLQSWIVFWIR